MRAKVRSLILWSACLLPAVSGAAQSTAVKPVHLTTEFRANPVGIGTTHPVFAWNLEPLAANARDIRQKAYRILVWREAPASPKRNIIVWDSGSVPAASYWQRPYGGPALASHTTYHWKVQVWSGSGQPGPWSGTGRFTTALLDQAEWKAHWIAAEPDRRQPAKAAAELHEPAQGAAAPPLPVFRNEFSLQKTISSALLHVSGLGQYEVHLNGRQVTSTVLNPGWTNYRKTVPYNTYDVSNLLREGRNAFAVLLGNGMYNVEGSRRHYTKFVGTFGQPKCVLQMEVRFTDGTSAEIVSDKSWRTHPGPVLYSSTYGGEDFDAAALPTGWELPGFNAAGWIPATEVAGPGGALEPEQSSPMVIAQSYGTVRRSTPKPGVAVYDLGVNMSGWPDIVVRGPAGSRINLLAGELLTADGTVTQRSANATPTEPVLFTYRLHGGGTPETWHPRFAYYSLRYVQVTTEPGSDTPQGRAPEILSVRGDFLHEDVPVVGRFSSASELFNRTHVLIDRAVLSNLASVLTDCPSREKLGWLEQTYLNAGTLMLNYGVTPLYEKLSHDIADAQLPDGTVPSIAPEYVAFVDAKGANTAFRDSPEWGSAIILSPWALFQLTGDDRPLRENYRGMQRYIDHLGSRTENGLLNYGLGDWYDIGPGAPGPSKLTSRLITATGVYYQDLTTLAQIASHLGQTEEADAYLQRADTVRGAFNARLFHPDTDQYDRGSQTANALPLALGMVPRDHVSAVLANLVADIHAHHDHVTAGDVGFHYVVRALTDLGRSDVLAAMLSRTDSPSYGYQLSRGATTLTEAWDANPESSQNHFMLGHAEEWFYRGLAGLSIDMSRGVDDAIRISPALVNDLPSAQASYLSPFGLVSAAWARKEGGITVTVSIPAGAAAHLQLPAGFSWVAADSFPPRNPGKLDAEPQLLGSGTYTYQATDASR